ncbi:MAG TPA: NEW3 domain-containing protein [Actinomycetota bacterium]|nr:NEW3 domain-containing protein [Actinomycetota bacterium]
MRSIRVLAIIVAAGAALAAVGAPSAAQIGISITTPYPAVAVEPGESATFDLQVTAGGRERVDLAVTQKPKGWDATLRGGGFVIDGVFTDPDQAPQAQLEVDVPAEAKGGTYRVVVAASSSAGSDTLELDLRVAKAATGSLELTSQFPSLQGPSDATFTFDLEVTNNTPQETTFSLEALGPEGWQVSARPAGQEQASTLIVAGGQTGSLTVTADPPDDVVANTYPIQVGVSGGGRDAATELQVEITGNFAMTVTTPDERLNVDVVADRTTNIALLVVNDGTAPLVGVELAATPPTDWNVEFTPPVIQQIAPGASAQAVASITPAGNAVAGDYVVTIDARIPETTSQMELRTTVKTSGFWGFVGILLIAGALVGLAWVFRRYGRR